VEQKNERFPMTMHDMSMQGSEHRSAFPVRRSLPAVFSSSIRGRKDKDMFSLLPPPVSTWTMAAAEAWSLHKMQQGCHLFFWSKPVPECFRSQYHQLPQARAAAFVRKDTENDQRRRDWLCFKNNGRQEERTSHVVDGIYVVIIVLK